MPGNPGGPGNPHVREMARLKRLLREQTADSDFLALRQQFFDLAIFAEWLFYMLTATTIFYYRKKHPELKRPFRVWGYPVLPAVFIVCAAAVVIASYRANEKASIIGTVVILLGLPVMWMVRRMYGKSIPMTKEHMY